MSTMHAPDRLLENSFLKPTTQVDNSAVEADDTCGHILTIVDGLQAGSSMRLPIGSDCIIGTEFDHDIVLVTDTDERLEMRLVCDARQIRVYVLVGEVVFNGNTLVAGNNCVLNLDCATIKIGSVQIKVQFKQNQGREMPKKSGESRLAGFLGSISENTMSRPLTYVCLFIGLMLLVGAVSTGLVRAVNVQEHRRSFDQILAEAGFGHLNYVPSLGNIPARVSGTVQSNEQKLNLTTLAESHGVPLVTDLQVNDQLRAEIENLYRINSVTAKVDVTGLGEVSIWTSTSDVEKLEMIEKSMKDDYPSLASITTSNTLPEDNVLVNNEDPFANNVPGKRITLIVAGEEGYLMTKDKARYFIGSTLPSGHVITKIEDGKVHVITDEGPMVLQF